MPKWTVEQQEAIDKENTNIIVSAGAGSGKTAVLSERVIRKLEEGVDIDHLLILTFTRAAAYEMMLRIRNKIKERPKLKEQLEKIDAAYITTFDSFSLSLVKKYHYLLNIDRDVKIGNATILDQERRGILDRIFDAYYEKEDPQFLAFLEQFTWKDDKEIKDALLTMNQKLDLKYDKISYLENYTKDYPKKVEHWIEEWEQFLKVRKKEVQRLAEELSVMVDGTYYQKIDEVLSPLFKASTYDEMVASSLEIRLPNLPRGSEEEVKKKKEELSASLKEWKEHFLYSSLEEIRQSFLSQETHLQLLIDILLELDQQIYVYKYTRDVYEFTDIAKMAIKLVKEEKEIREDLKYYFNEIMVDEYQDTSDLQEEFIQAIANDNVYMVGDIKQSIYRFRNANPYIFKHKYDAYGRGEGGFKIDLMKNFRSRKEVLANINAIFDVVMDDFLGGCNYQKEHQMIFGNTAYEANQKASQNSNLEVYNYSCEKGYSKDEMEAFIILRDIQKKVEDHYQVVDKETFTLRDVRYSDFAILIDRATKFELFKKIFEYYQVPMAVFKDMTITKENDIYMISHLLKLVYLSYHKDSGEDFRYSYMSVARSYLLEETDEDIFEVLESKRYQESKLYQLLRPLVEEYPCLNGENLLEGLIQRFSFYQKQTLVGNMDSFMARVSYLKDLFREMNELGYSLDEVIVTFSQMVEEGQEIRVSFSEENSDAVKIMTIHKSKGLEFPILYMAGLSHSFNIRDLNERFIYDLKYGFLLPFSGEEEKPNVLKFLLKEDYLKEEISEKIRLFYVALTRAREKMILLTNTEEEDELSSSVSSVVENTVRLHYRSFLDILKSIWGKLQPYQLDISNEVLELSKDYNFVKTSNWQSLLKKSRQKISYRAFQPSYTKLSREKFSKSVKELLTKENYEAVELGKRFHHIFETIDFKHPDFSDLTSFEKKTVEPFFQLPIVRDLEDATVFREYEFLYQQDHQKRHGIIDLMIEKEDKIILVDYKLKHVVDDAYRRQLLGYKDYVERKTDKPIEVYLYSILDQRLTPIEE